MFATIITPVLLCGIQLNICSCVSAICFTIDVIRQVVLKWRPGGAQVVSRFAHCHHYDTKAFIRHSISLRSVDHGTMNMIVTGWCPGVARCHHFYTPGVIRNSIRKLCR